MTDLVAKTLTNPGFLVGILVTIAVFATLYLALPAIGGSPLKARMKTVALEREELRVKQRARLAAEADRRRGGLREEQSLGMKNIVERLDLRRHVHPRRLRRHRGHGGRDQGSASVLPGVKRRVGYDLSDGHDRHDQAGRLCLVGSGGRDLRP